MQSARSLPAIGLLLAAAGLSVSESTAQERELRDLGDFDSIAVSGVDLKIRQGDDFVVEVFGSGDLESLVTEITDGTLQIHRRRGTAGFFGLFAPHYSVDVTLPRLEALSAGGGADVTVDGRITGEQLDITSSGGSDVSIEVAVSTLNVHAAGGSDVRLSGSARAANLQTNGGSDVDGRNFVAITVDVSSSGGSDSYFGVEDELTGNVSGGSDVVYTGEPALVSVNKSVDSDVIRR